MSDKIKQKKTVQKKTLEKKITGYGVSLNTSFNLHGRTIVRTPNDALVDFIDCNID